MFGTYNFLAYVDSVSPSNTFKILFIEIHQTIIFFSHPVAYYFHSLTDPSRNGIPKRKLAG